MQTILSVLPTCLSMWDPGVHEAKHKPLPHSTVSPTPVCPPHSPHTQTCISVTLSVCVTPLQAEEIAAPSLPGGHPCLGRSCVVPLKRSLSLLPGRHQDGHPYIVALEQFLLRARCWRSSSLSHLLPCDHQRHTHTVLVTHRSQQGKREQGVAKTID